MSKFKHRRKKIHSGKWQLNAIGIFLLVLLFITAWWLWIQPLAFTTVVPLVFVLYAAFRIVFELTINRDNLPTLATSRAARKRISALVTKDAAQIGGKKYSVVDLGSGRGELSRRIARAIPYAQVVGIECAPIPFMQSQAIRTLFGPANLVYKKLNFWPYDCSMADTVMLYLNQRLAKKAGEKLRKEMKPGSLVISYNFPLLGDWEPIETIDVHTPFKETIYVYRQH